MKNNDATGKHFSLKSFAKGAFNFAAGAAVGIGVRTAVKTAAFALLSSQAAAFAAIGVGAVAIGVANTAIERGKDMYKWNKAHADAKVKVTDFFSPEKTGQNGKHYLKKGALSAGFALAGGIFGYFLSDWIHGAHAAAPPVDHTPPPVAVTPPPVVASPDDSYAVAKGDNLWNIVKAHYHLTGNADIQRYTDAVAVANHLTEGTAANNLYIGEHVSLPSMTALATRHVLALDWHALDAQTAARHAAHHLAPQ